MPSVPNEGTTYLPSDQGGSYFLGPWDGTNFWSNRSATADSLDGKYLFTFGDMVYNGTNWDRHRAAYADALTAAGIPASGLVGYNGASWDRLRTLSSSGDGLGVLLQAGTPSYQTAFNGLALTDANTHYSANLGFHDGIGGISLAISTTLNQSVYVWVNYAGSGLWSAPAGTPPVVPAYGGSGPTYYHILPVGTADNRLISVKGALLGPFAANTLGLQVGIQATTIPTSGSISVYAFGTY